MPALGGPLELEFAINCCHWRRTPALDQEARAALPLIDWSLFLRIVQRHRIAGLVWHVLKPLHAEIDPGSAATLRRAADGIAADNLLILRECVRLNELFTEREVDLLFIKGLTLGQLAYGTILPKAGWDIDILVRDEQLNEAADILRVFGYEPTRPLSANQLKRWHRREKESVWHHSGHGTTVELHTALANHPVLLSRIGMDSPRQRVALPGGTMLPTLRQEELFAYLTVHGASSAWFRLKWSADLAALVADCSAEEVHRLYLRAKEFGAGRAADLALLLLHRLYGTALPPLLLPELGSRPINRWLLKAAFWSLSGRTLTREPRDLRFGTIWIHLLQLGLWTGIRYPLSEFRRQLWSWSRAGVSLKPW